MKERWKTGDYTVAERELIEMAVKWANRNSPETDPLYGYVEVGRAADRVVAERKEKKG